MATKSITHEERTGYIASLRAGLTSLFQSSACTFGCTATVPAEGTVGTGVTYVGSGTATGCSTTPSYQWDMGDGSTISTNQNPKHTYQKAGTYSWKMFSSLDPSEVKIDSIVGGAGDGKRIPNIALGGVTDVVGITDRAAIAIADDLGGHAVIRYYNGTDSEVIIAGVKIPGHSVKTIAGLGNRTEENIPANDAKIGRITGMTFETNKKLLYYLDALAPKVRAINLSSVTQIVADKNVESGNVITLATLSGTSGTRNFTSLAVHPTNGEVYYCDGTPSVNKVKGINIQGTIRDVAGNGASTNATDPLPSSTSALNYPLLEPRAVSVSSTSGNLYIADSGHGRIIRINNDGSASLIWQFQVTATSNPYPNGLGITGGALYCLNGNDRTIYKLSTSGLTPTLVAGGSNASVCDYSGGSKCGDGGSAISARFNFRTSSDEIPYNGFDDRGGVSGNTPGFVLSDQGKLGKGRIRFYNASDTTASTFYGSGTPLIKVQNIDTVIGSGVASPFDGGPATDGLLVNPVGVSDATNTYGNIVIADTGTGKIRIVNRSTSDRSYGNGTSSTIILKPGEIISANKGATTSDARAPIPINDIKFKANSIQGIHQNSTGGVYVVGSIDGPQIVHEGVPVSSSQIYFLNLAPDSSRNVTLFPSSVRPITVPFGQAVKIAGGGSIPNGDGGIAQDAVLIGASDLTVTADGSIYVTDVGQNAVRKINGSTGVISSLNLSPSQYTGLGLNSNGALYIADYKGGLILSEDGPGTGTFSILKTGINKPRDVAVTADGSAYVTAGPANTIENQQIILINPLREVITIAGSSGGFAGDGGPAPSSRIAIIPPDLEIGSNKKLPMTVNIVVGADGAIYFASTNNGRIRRLSPALPSCYKTGTIVIKNPVPQLTKLNPNAAKVGSTDHNVTIYGTGFVPDSIASWNGQNRTTTYISPTELRVVIPAADLVNKGVILISVVNPTPGGGTSNVLPFTVSNPAITKLDSDRVVEGSGDTTVKVIGEGFEPNTLIRWNGTNRVTNYISSTEVTFVAQSADLATAGTAQITAYNPAPIDSTSNALTFTIYSINPLPQITTLSPDNIEEGAPETIITVTGNNFTSDSKVHWNSQVRETIFIAATQLQVKIPASDLTTTGIAQITVVNPAPGGGTSNTGSFTINNPNLNELYIKITPDNALAGSGEIEVVITGAGFNNKSKVNWDGQARATTYVSSTGLKFKIPASDLTTAGTANITVVNPAPGGGTSNPATFTINNPDISELNITISPDNTVAGSDEIEVTITGSGFNTNSKALWDGQERPTTYVSTTQLKVKIPSSDLIIAMTVNIRVANPAPGGGTSNAATFTIKNPDLNGLKIALNPDNTMAGSSDTQVTVFGFGFNVRSKVNWNGQERATAFLDGESLRFTIPAADLANAGTAQVTVVNQAPGGGTSNAATFTINNPSLTGLNIRINPDNTVSGSPDTEITVNGTGFNTVSKVNWNGQERATIYVSATELKVTISSADLTTPDVFNIRVVNPTPGGGTSNAVPFTVRDTSPDAIKITLSPDNALAGSGDTVVRVTGKNFNSGSKVQWKGLDRSSIYISETQIDVTIPASDLTTAGTAVVRVVNPDGKTSNPAVFTINNPSLTGIEITLSPSEAIVDSADTEVTVNGRNFVPNSKVQWEGQDRVTTYVSATQLKFTAPAADLKAPKVAQVRVVNPGPGGGISNTANFKVVSISTNAINITISPDNALAGSAEIEVTVRGNDFTSTSKVLWDGQERLTTYVSATELKVKISASDLEKARVGEITELTPGKGLSNAAAFTIKNPDLTGLAITLNPDNGLVGSGPVEVTVSGNNFNSSSIVQWNGQDRVTTYVSATDVKFTIPASDLTAAGTVEVKVINPGPGGGISNAATFSIKNPDLSGVSITIAPDNTLAGSAEIEVKITGTGFNAHSKANWNGAERPTTYVSATELMVKIPATDMTTAGTAQLTVVNPAPGGGTSNAATFTIKNPDLSGLAITIAPDNTLVGSAEIEVKITGTGFNANSKTNWNGAERPTTYVSATELKVKIPATDLSLVGTAQITIVNPAPGGGTSNAATFTIKNPDINGLSITIAPNNTMVGSGETEVIITGTGFNTTSQAHWNGEGRITTYVSTTELKITVPFTDLTKPGTAQITVFNPSPGGGTSNAAIFTINNPDINDLKIAISPNNTLAGSPDTQVTVFDYSGKDGSFNLSSKVHWNGQERATTFISNEQLRFTIPAADLATAGTAKVTVVNPAPGGGTSNVATFTINNPSLTGLNIRLSSDNTSAGSSDTEITISGSGFNANSKANWKGQDRITTYVSATELKVTIPASDLTMPDVFNIMVVNPAPGGGTSNAATFTIKDTSPDAINITLSPDNVLAGSGDMVVRVNGNSFNTGSKVQWNGSDRTSTYVSDTQMDVTIPATDLTTASTAVIKVVNPDGKTSNPAVFTINNPSLTGLSITLTPEEAFTESPDMEVTVNGQNFVPNSIVQWEGQDRVTTYISATELKFTLPAADMVTPKIAQVRVVNPGPGGGISNSARFTIEDLQGRSEGISISPDNTLAGSPEIEVTVSGNFFSTDSKVLWNGQERPTTYVSGNELKVRIPASDLERAGYADVSVLTPGRNLSNSAQFTIKNPDINGLAIIINPSIGKVGSGPIEVTVSGNNFNTSSIVQWNGQDRVTTYISATEVKFTIPASDLTSIGAAEVKIVNPGSGGGTSNAATFNIFATITAPVPGGPVTPLPGGPGGPVTPLFNPTGSGSAVGSGAGSGTGLSTNVLSPGQIITTLGSIPVAPPPAIEPPPVSPIIIRAAIERAIELRKSDRQNIIEGKLRIIDQMIVPLLPLNYGLYYNSVKAEGLITSGIAIPYSADRVPLLHKGPLPTELNGLSITVIDSSGTGYSGRKFSISPTHLNWLVPAEVQDGPATLVFKENGVVTATKSINIERTSPGIFTLDSTGTGVPTAMLLRGKIDGTQIKEPIARYDEARGVDVHIPIDLGDPTDQVLLVLCGTGFRNHSPVSNVTATVGGVPVEVYYSGPTNEHVGLDQVNVLLPASLVGRGEVPVVVTFGAKTANTVMVNIK